MSDELAKAVNSQTGGRGGAGGSSNGASGEWRKAFNATAPVARAALIEFYRRIDGFVGASVNGKGSEGNASDGTLVAAHWIYRYRDREGAIRIRLIQTGRDEWLIIVFRHET